MELDISFPLEFLVFGTPVSSGSQTPASREAWKERVKEASYSGLGEGHWAAKGRISVTIYYFPPEKRTGDVDNIVKLILDAMNKHVYMDDSQVERVVVQKFEPDNVFQFGAPSAILAGAMGATKPVVYVRVSDNPFEELA